MTSIPLVIYISGERKVIGSANVVDDGADFVVTATVDAESAKDLFPPKENFSIGHVPDHFKAELGESSLSIATKHALSRDE